MPADDNIYSNTTPWSEEPIDQAVMDEANAWLDDQLKEFMHQPSATVGRVL